MSKWNIIGIMLLLALLGFIPTLLRRKRLEINISIFIFIADLACITYLLVIQFYPKH
jgi:hypothetical protein